MHRLLILKRHITDLQKNIIRTQTKIPVPRRSFQRHSRHMRCSQIPRRSKPMTTLERPPSIKMVDSILVAPVARSLVPLLVDFMGLAEASLVGSQQISISKIFLGHLRVLDDGVEGELHLEE